MIFYIKNTNDDKLMTLATNVSIKVEFIWQNFDKQHNEYYCRLISEWSKKAIVTELIQF